MSQEIIINVTAGETRVALVENGLVMELYVEREREKSIVGNLYMGKVLRVLPGMQAAFVDVGLEKAAFLYVSDFYEEMDEYEVGGDRGLDDDYRRGRSGGGAEPKIQDLLKEGQEILVQIAKEPMGTKGARITSHVSLPGRNLVFMPYVNHVGVSRRIESDRERRRLRDIVQKAKLPGCGFIVRTASGGTTAEELHADMDYLVKLWEGIREQKDKLQAPSLVHEELPLSRRAVRDLYTNEVDRLVIDDEEQYSKIGDFIRTFMPATKHNVELYAKADDPIFDHFSIEVDIDEALRRKVWLKSGGYIIVEQTEALTSIDINTGRYVGKRSLEDTILKTNLEAVKEIVYQLRFRNIGGIIIIDFIDMETRSNREKVYSAFREALRRDKSKTNILKISELGLVEMTRKRTRENINQILCESCPYCEGRGFVKSKVSICYKIFREVKREAANFRGQKIVVNTHPEVADLLYDEEHVAIEELERATGKTIILRAKPTLHQESFEIHGI